MGTREQNILDAVEQLNTKEVWLKALSTIIETKPIGGPPQDNYLNAVGEFETYLTPTQLLDVAKAIEADMGRIKTVPNGPRCIDIDILLYDDMQIDSEHLTIPHPRMNERDFVLIPLKEISS